jgi:hypothetical protein
MFTRRESTIRDPREESTEVEAVNPGSWLGQTGVAWVGYVSTV